jgi:AAA domain/Bifunctional DNA primase/polymerase, N-terminal
MIFTETRKKLLQGGFEPLPVNGKIPVIKDWQKIVIDDAEVTRWEKLPNAGNTGLRTRRMPTLDADILDPAASEAIERLVHERFKERGLILTRIGKEPKRAFPFRTDTPFPKIVINLVAPDGDTSQKLEFLGDGQQLVGFGTHPDTGKRYKWHGIKGSSTFPKLEALPPITEDEAQELIEDAADLLCADFGYTHPPESSGSGTAADWGPLLAKIHAGTELHTSIRDLAFKLKMAGMGSGAIVNLLRQAMENCTASHDDRWQERYDDIPRAVQTAEEKLNDKVFDSIAEAYAERVKKDEGQSTDDGRASSDDGPKQFNQRFKLTAFKGISLSTTALYLVKGIVPHEGLIVVWGEPKCGKSFWTFDLALHVALGRQYRDYKVKQGCVVYFALEGSGGFNKRIEAWRMHHILDRSTDVPFHLLASPVDLIRDQKNIIQAIEAQGVAPALVVIDTLNRSLNGSENDPKDMGNFVKAADAIRERFGAAVIVIHHCGINGERPRGHSSLTSAVDAQLVVKRTAEGIITEVELMKDGAADVVLHSRLEVVGVGYDDEGDAMTSCVCVPSHAGWKHGDMEKEDTITGDTRAAYILLRDLILVQGETVPKVEQKTRKRDIKCVSQRLVWPAS